MQLAKLRPTCEDPAVEKQFKGASRQKRQLSDLHKSSCKNSARSNATNFNNQLIRRISKAFIDDSEKLFCKPWIREIMGISLKTNWGIWFQRGSEPRSLEQLLRVSDIVENTECFQVHAFSFFPITAPNYLAIYWLFKTCVQLWEYHCSQQAYRFALLVSGSFACGLHHNINNIKNHATLGEMVVLPGSQLSCQCKSNEVWVSVNV